MNAAILALVLAPIGSRILDERVEMPRILSLREQADLRDRWLEIRLDTLLPALLRREEIDLWIVAAREYNEDPVFETMVPARWLAARRRTVLLFHDRGGEAGVERRIVARYDLGGLYEAGWDPEEEPDQWKRLAGLVAERDPRRIAINVSPEWALADGLSAAERDALLAALAPPLRERVVSGEGLAIGWLETRIPEEMAVYPTIARIAHRILAEGLSARAIQPGFTTTEDLGWWYRERIRGLGLDTWFHPSVSVQRAGDVEGSDSFASRPGPRTIERGDLVHVDFGITYLGLNTDTQQHAYVLRSGEGDAPEGLKKGLATGNRLQDILTSNFREGRSGNEILAAALAQAKAAGIRARIYTHPLGFHGHAAGPLIGLWDQQGGVPGRGDAVMRRDTVHSIELGATVPVPEWGGRDVRILLEEDAFFDGTEVRYLDGRQTDLWLIR